MDIRYIKKSTEKLSPDNMMNVINDIITKSDLEVIENYNVNKLYNRGDKVYIKNKDKHRVYVCEGKTKGDFDISKWRPYLKKDDNRMTVNQLYTYEEKIIVDRYGLFDHKIKLDNFKYDNTSVAVFSSITPRLRYGIDFLFTSDGVVKFLKPMNKGEKLILEIRILNGKLFNNLFREVYVEETYIPVKRTKFIPIRYHGYRSSSKIELFGKDGKLYEEGIDYTLDHNYIIMKDYINPGTLMSVTMWNEVMITVTSDNYIMDELGNYYKLNITDSAQLSLDDIDDDNILSKGYIDLMSEDGTLYRCRATSEHHLILQEVEPDIILATDDKKYRISVNIEGQLYVQEVESDYYKNIYIISTDKSIYELCVVDGILDTKQVVSSGIGEALENKHILSDDGKVYEITLNGEEILLNLVETSFETEQPVEYVNLISPSGMNFMFFSTNDAHLAVRCNYVVDNNVNVILGDNGDLYYLGMTNEGDFYIQRILAAPYVAEQRLITDEQGVEYELHIDEDEYIYFTPTGRNTGNTIPLILESDAKDTYICILSGSDLISYPESQSSILKDIKTGFTYKVFVDNNKNLDMKRIDTEYVEKDFIEFVTSNKQYKMVINDGVIEVIETGIILPQKSDTEFKIKDEYDSKEYVIYVNNEGNLVFK